MADNLPALNLQTPLVERDGAASRYFKQYMDTRDARLQSAPYAAAGQVLRGSGLSAAVASSALVTAAPSTLYRVNYLLRVSQAAGVSSAMQLTVTWTQGGIVQTKTSANVNGNTTTSLDTGCFLVRPDAGTNVTYAISYASNPGGAAQFDYDLSAEALN